MLLDALSNVIGAIVPNNNINNGHNRYCTNDG